MRPAPAVLAALLAAAALTACGDDADPATPPAASAKPGPGVTADLLGPDGAKRGTVSIYFDGDSAVVDVQATGLTPGPARLPPAQDRQVRAEEPRPRRPGDDRRLPVRRRPPGEGGADARQPHRRPALAHRRRRRDRVAHDAPGPIPMADVLDADGTAVMVHAKADNFGNVPDRYAPQGVDDTTKKTGDAGPRVACAALTAAP